MISVTGEYLIDIIERHISKTIQHRRQLMPNNAELPPQHVTNEELADFILSIPFFDNGLKDFILGNTTEQTVIVSQAWEIAFIIRTKKWAESEDWLAEPMKPAPKFYLQPVHPAGDFLKLPY